MHFALSKAVGFFYVPQMSLSPAVLKIHTLRLADHDIIVSVVFRPRL
jgi:hypothetical protein